MKGFKVFINTHKNINYKLCGEPAELKENEASVTLTLTEDMACDDYKLVHGGFIFGLADYAAMLSINHPNVVLGKSEITFLSPSKVGDTLIANATVIEANGKKNIVSCSVFNGKKKCAEGQFTCFITDKHILE